MSSKDVGVRVRIEKELREAFLSACRTQDRHASDVLREFMRSYADRHLDGKQASLFTEVERKDRKKRVTPKEIDGASGAANTRST